MDSPRKPKGLVPRVYDDDVADVDATKITRQGAGASPANLHAYVVVLEGQDVGAMYKLERATMVLGRSPGVDIQLLDDGVSRKHARLVKEGSDTFVVEDLGSANGTLMNGVKVDRCTLKDGDKLQLGETTILKFTLHDTVDETFQRRMYNAAIRDGLTGAFNKRYFLERIETELAYARRHAAPLALLLLDVDHFKKINDTFGHLIGDHVLAKLSRIAVGTLRAEDVFARYGGEEFVVLSRGISLENALVIGERLRGTVGAAPFEIEGVAVSVTVSVGVAALPALDATTGWELIHGADRALYEAKRTGRNRVCFSRT